MSKTTRNLRVDRDGVRVFETETAKRFDTRAVMAVLAVIVVGVGAFLLRPSSAPAPSPSASRVVEREPDAAMVEVAAMQAAQNQPVMRPNRNVRAVHVNPDVAPRGQAAPQEEDNEKKKDQPGIDARDVILALQASGEKEGIAAFNPPGTNPPKSGIIVPEDYQMPEGYVRHYQVTDDGQRLDPILMFSPDYQFVDASGNPISLPEDLIVPPEMAPPGLPIRMLEVPKRRLH